MGYRDLLQRCRQAFHKVENSSSDQGTLEPTIYTSPERAKPTSNPSITRPQSNLPICANFASNKLTIGAGVAIFHIASARVVVCWHSRDNYWFLPKGRRDAGEDSGAGAEREGFEEVWHFEKCSFQMKEC